MKDANGTPSPAATGGGGEQFEQHVAGLALGLLLVRGMPPVLTDTSVVEVHLQTGHCGWATDDVLVVGERSDGSRRQLAVQAKRSFRVSASDDDCRKTIKAMWNDFGAERFDASRDQLAVATLHGTSVLLRDFVSLLECARASINAEDFGRRLSVEGLLSTKAKEQNRAIRQILAKEEVDPPDDDVYWRFLRTINILSFDLNTPTSQTEAWLLTLLQGCTADGSQNNNAGARGAWAMLLASAGAGKPAAKSYARENLPAELRRRYAPVSSMDRDGLQVLVEHGQTVRTGIRSTIADGYAIERSDLVQSVAEKLAAHRVVIVTGPAGSGKSALARGVLARLEDRYPVLSFQAVEFATAHVDETLGNAQTSLNLQRLLALLAGHDRKIVLVDGVERLLERPVRDGFSQLLQLAEKDPSTWIVLTVRDYSLETVRNSLIPVEVQPRIFEVPALTDAELDSAANGVPLLAKPLANAKLRAFLRTPYLVDLASRLHWGGTAFPASFVEFRRKVWQELIRDDGHAARGMPGRRERAFLELAWRRAVELRPFVAPGVDDTDALEALRRDSLVTTPLDSSAVYSVTHDVLEDWGVLQRLEDRFAESDGSVTVLQEAVGGYPAIRRGLRQWLTERFERRPDEALGLVLSAIDSRVLASYFRDDCVVAALLSGSAGRFVDACRPRIVRGDLDLLERVTHVLRVACMESPKWLDVPGLPSQMLVPIGPGWVPTLRLVLTLTDALLPQRLLLVLGLVEDWAKQVDWRNRAPTGAKEAGAIVDRLLSDLEDYGWEDARQRALKVVVKIPAYVPQFKKLMDRARTCRHRERTAFDLSNLVLTKPEGAFVCWEFPDEVIALLDARLRLSPADRKRERGFMGSPREEVDYGFGVRGLPMGSYYPGSALQGPFGALLRSHARKAVEFNLSLLNHAGRSYATEQWPGRVMEPAWKTLLAVPNHGTVEQWANGRLYGLYRGNKVGPDSLVSALMALESWLLWLGKMDGVDLEGWLLHVLGNSNNVMATGVVASVCVAYPERAGRAGLGLLSSRDVVQLDRERLALESSTPFEAFAGLNPRYRLFEQERKEANELSHRREDLESLAVRMQLGKHRDEVWEIIDRHRAELPGEPREETRVWRLALHRMDVRGYEPQEAPEGARFEGGGDARHGVYFGPGKMETDVREMVEAAAGTLEAVNRHLSLANLARKMWERDESVAEVDWRASLLATAQAVEGEIDRAEEFRRDGPGLAAAVCIRDHLEELDDSQLEWCARRVDLEVRRKAKTVELAERLGRIVRADRMCASVVPALVVHSRKAVGVDPITLLSVALTHPIDEVVDYAFSGLGAFVGEDHKALVLQCVAAAAYRARLARKAWNASRDRRVAGVYDRSDTFQSVVLPVRRAIEDGSLDPAKELRRLDLGNPVVGASLGAILTVLERHPNWEESRNFYSRVSQWLVDAWRDDDRSAGHTERNFELEGSALRSFARFALRLPGAEAVRISAPVVEAVRDQRQEVDGFVSELIVSADGNADDCFWELWQRLADTVARSGWGSGLTDDTSFGLGLLHMIFLGPYWKEGVKQWHRLDGHTDRMEELARRLPATVPVLRAYTDYLGMVGHQSLPAAFVVVAHMLEKGDARRIASDSGVAFNLETLLRPFAYSQPHLIKTDTRLRQAVLVILDALVAGGSASAYRMRDDFVTPYSG